MRTRYNANRVQIVGVAPASDAEREWIDLCTGQLLCRDKDTGGYDESGSYQAGSSTGRTMLSGICPEKESPGVKEAGFRCDSPFFVPGACSVSRKRGADSGRG